MTKREGWPKVASALVFGVSTALTPFASDARDTRAVDGYQSVQLPQRAQENGANPLENFETQTCMPQHAPRLAEGQYEGQSINGLRIVLAIGWYASRAHEARQLGKPSEDVALGLIRAIEGCTPQDFDAAEAVLSSMTNVDAETIRLYRETVGDLRLMYVDQHS